MLDRRTLIRGAAALAVSRFLLAARDAQPVDAPLRGPLDPFALGVASGEPVRDGFVLWTRLVGVRGDRVIGWEIAADAGFRRIVRRGRTVASAGRGHAVHLEVAGLAPGRPYFYRFHAGGHVSRIGRTCTAPASADRLRLALTSCQHWEQGYFGAYRDMVERDVDVIVHVGDYIYEKSFGKGPDVRSFGAPEPRTLSDYRGRYALYRTDPDLAAAHAALPFVVCWDDHEVENDYVGERGVATADPHAFLARRAAAYQAYFEHMPLRPSVLRPGGEVRLYRTIDWGELARLHVLDTRQYRTPHPCDAPGKRGGQVVRTCDAARDPAATMMGAMQERWLARSLADERARWTFIAQQTLFSRLHLPDGPDAAYSDIWDGYAATRNRVIKSLAAPAVRNPVLLGGDVHSFWFNDILRDFDRPENAPVATEIVTSCLASRSGPEALFGPALRLNPHVRFLDNQHAGYVLLDVTRDRVAVEARAVTDLTDPHSICRPLARRTIEDRRPGVQA
ncbi:alkaline phosphatase D family protein [Sphingomonas sp. TX0522]|jgi:alkaline phosphatase D|uniref:alkaline phosphatase D family protein n=1 Tax=Sphingomonas sp. TX0522 TaxID=2479205 RepID=UPI0018DFC568|nr:alkaline phosphatase D family protein [Sphingomonas sp. TX0522]MBI0531990.1 alkaline phosphatase [Sphingomonas sp. TX0522]